MAFILTVIMILFIATDAYSTWDVSDSFDEKENSEQ